MSVLGKETQNIQNAGLGAALLWRFSIGYAKGSQVNEPTPLPLMFVVLPIAFHQETAAFLKSTQRTSGLRAFADKFGETRNARKDLILSIHDRALTMRDLTFHALSLGVASSLITFDTTKGLVIPLSTTTPRVGIPQSVRPMLNGVEKLGDWCSKLSLYEIALVLKVVF